MRSQRTPLVALLCLAAACAPSAGAPEEEEEEEPAPPPPPAAGRTSPDAATTPPVRPPDAGAPAPDGARDTAAPAGPDASAPELGPGGDAAPAARRQRIFETNVLHEVQIQVAPELLMKLLTDKTTRTPCTVTFDGVAIPMAGVRRKGLYGSNSNTKPSFSVKLDTFVAGQDLDGVDKFVLNNSVQDPSFLNEPLGYELYRIAGMASPRTAHAVVVINGQSYGLYVIKEAIDKDFLSRWFGAAYRGGNVYEGTLTDFARDPLKVELKDEKEEMRKRDDIIALADVVRNTPNDQLADAVSKKLDFDRFMTSMAIDLVVSHYDDYMYGSNNYYLYDNPRDMRFVLIPHGMDWMFSARATFPTSRQVHDLDPFVPLASVNAGVGPGRLAARVREIPALEARLRKEVGRVIREVWDTTKLTALMDDVAAVVKTNKRTDARTMADVASFNRMLPVMKSLLVNRKSFVIARTP